ncbi:uncharacterized protein [Rutidosis leptorrhynchoides]|uniref:uncharacterized protein n=1 Tax=Rutidosis leptorrhynchoides TaxID=125765 RepID=UPI003A9A1F2F
MGDSSSETSATLISKLDFGDPLYLHASDISGTPLISVKLVGTENYRVWACAMTLALETKNKIGFIDESVVKEEEDDVLAKQWDMCNAVVLSWILGSISEELYLGQIFSKIASEVWKELKETYDKVDGSVMKNILIRSNLLTSDQLPTIKSAYAILSREESHRDSSKSISGKLQASAFLSKTSSNTSNAVNGFNSNNFRTGKGPNPNLKCTKCNKVGHTIDRCFEVVGYPAWFKGKGNNNTNNSFKSTNSWSNNNSTKSFVSNSSITEKQSALTLSEDQISRLLSLLSNNMSDEPKANMAGNIQHTNQFHSNLSSSQFFASMAGNNPNLNTFGWIIDSGANQHYVNNKNKLHNLVDVSDLGLVVGHPNGSYAKITTIGDYKLTSNVTLFDVLVIPEYIVSLLSVSKLARDSKRLIGFDEYKCYVQDLPQGRVMGRTLGTGSMQGGLYYFDSIGEDNICCTSDLNVCMLSKYTWHHRLGHPADPVLHVLKNKLSYGNEKLMPCEICHKAKQTRYPFPLSDHKTKEIGELVHLDLWGPYKVATRDGYKYFLTIVDDHSRAVWVFLLKSKSDTSQNIIDFVEMFQTQFNKNIKTVRSDNGGVPLSFWGDCVLTATYLINRTPSSVLNGKSPYEIIYGREPSLNHLRVFGCLCFATKLNNSDKFASRADKCVFVGYSNVQKGYKLYNLDTKLMTFSRDVKFYEQVFPFKMSSKITSDVISGLDHLNFFDNLEDPYDDKSKTDYSDGNGKSALGSSSAKSTISPSSNIEYDLHGNKRSNAGGSNDSVSTKDVNYGNDSNTKSTNADDPNATHVDIEGLNNTSNSEGSSSIEPTSSLRRSSRVTTLPKRFEEFVLNDKVKFGIEKGG